MELRAHDKADALWLLPDGKWKCREAARPVDHPRDLRDGRWCTGCASRWIRSAGNFCTRSHFVRALEREGACSPDPSVGNAVAEPRGSAMSIALERSSGSLDFPDPANR